MIGKRFFKTREVGSTRSFEPEAEGNVFGAIIIRLRDRDGGYSIWRYYVVRFRYLKKPNYFF